MLPDIKYGNLVICLKTYCKKARAQNDEIIALITKSLLKISISICDESPQADKKAIIKENDSHSQIMSFG